MILNNEEKRNFFLRENNYDPCGAHCKLDFIYLNGEFQLDMHSAHGEQCVS